MDGERVILRASGIQTRSLNQGFIMESKDLVPQDASLARTALMSGTIQGTYVRRRDRKAYSYKLSWSSTSRDVSWSATIEGLEGPSGTLDVAVGTTASALEQMVRSAAHATLEGATEGPTAPLATLRAALLRSRSLDS